MSARFSKVFDGEPHGDVVPRHLSVAFFLCNVPSLLRARATTKVTVSQFGAAALALSAALLAGCATGPQAASADRAPVIFPPPPEEPRFIYEMTLVSSAQVTVNEKKARLRTMLTGETQTGEPMFKPFDVSVCRGVVYVSDTVARRVLAYDFPQRRFFKIGEDEPGGLLKPLGLANDSECRLYVADGTQQRIMIYDRDGKFLTGLGGPDWFHHLSHVAADKDGARVYAVDTGGVDSSDHRVRVFDARDGRHLHDFGTRGTQNGQFNLPRDIVLAPDGNLYVVDGGNFRVQVFSPDGSFVRSFGSMGAQFGQFTRPKGIAADPAGNIYVADAAFGNFQIFDPQGQLLLNVGSRSNTPGPAKFALPAGVDVDEDGRAYVVDQYFRKVDIFRPAQLPAGKGHLARGVNAEGEYGEADQAIGKGK